MAEKKKVENYKKHGGKSFFKKNMAEIFKKNMAEIFFKKHGGKFKKNMAEIFLKKHDGKFPWSYLDKSLEDILNPLEVSVEEFVKVCDQFTNKKIFKTNRTGDLMKDKKGNLVKQAYPE